MSSICSISSCVTSTTARGYCKKHYTRWYRNGDPLVAKTTPGAINEFIESLPSTGASCVIWPFARNKYGYAKNARSNATRVVCEKFHGKPPTRYHQAAHSCGKGHLGCISPWHLSWKTPKENCADTLYVHKTASVGSRRPNAKLTEEKVLRIRAIGHKFTHGVLAEKFGVSRQGISKVLAGLIWRHIPGHEIR